MFVVGDVRELWPFLVALVVPVCSAVLPWPPSAAEQAVVFPFPPCSRFDACLASRGVWKVETAGDAYLVAGGLIDEDQVCAGVCC